MGVVKCPDCGLDVSDRANTCIHCGAPLNFSVENGHIRIKCAYINGASLGKANIYNSETGELIASIKQNEVIALSIKKDTHVDISFLLMKGTSGILKYKGTHNYEISVAPGFFTGKLVLNEVTNIDSD